MSDLRVYNSWKQKSPAFLRNKTNMKSLGTQRRKKEFTEVVLMRREERGKREGACPLPSPPPPKKKIFQLEFQGMSGC